MLLVMLIMTLYFFRIEDVPKIKWSYNLKLDKKEAGDLYLMNKMLEAKYGQEHVKVITSQFLDTLIDNNTDNSTLNDSHLLLRIDQHIYLQDSSLNEILDLCERGNEVLLISSYLNLNSDILKDSFRINIKQKSYNDTMLYLTWEDSTRLEYTHLWRDHERNRYQNSRYFTEKEDLVSNTIYDNHLQVNDSMSIFRSYKVGAGQLHVHSVPRLFINSASLQDIYLENFTKTFDLVDAQNIWIHVPKNKNINVGANKLSKIQYILSQPPLKSSYYLILLTALLYVLFSSKRKQKIIPTKTENKNTSLEYIDTISALYAAQNQNSKLVPHMEKIFHNHIKKQYFLDKNTEDYAQKLSHKAKVPVVEVNKILNKFRQPKSHHFTDDQLFRLYNDIINFHKKAK